MGCCWCEPSTRMYVYFRCWTEPRRARIPRAGALSLSSITSSSTPYNKRFPGWGLRRTSIPMHMLDESSLFLSTSIDKLVWEFKRTELALRIGVRFSGWEWLDLQSSLRSSKTLWTESISGIHPNSADSARGGETCTSVSAESVLLELLRHMARNPAVFGLYPGLGRRQREPRALSMTAIRHDSLSTATVPVKTGGIRTLLVVGNNPLPLIRIHPALRLLK